MNKSRILRLASLLNKSPLDMIVLNPGPTMVYITGLQFHLMERPTLFILSSQGKAAMILPELEILKIKATLPDMECFTYNDNPGIWGTVIKTAFTGYQLSSPRIGIEPNRMRYLELNFIQQSVQAPQFSSVEPLISSMRIQKDQTEIKMMHTAVDIAQQALKNTLPLIKIGMSEKSIAAELTINMLRAGSDPELPFPPIVSSGPNSANPHAEPSDRKIQAGDTVVIDWGASHKGYFSDLTRTIAIGTLDEELFTIYEAVKHANHAGRGTAKPGIPAGDVDRSGRKVIVEAGYGHQFTHRIGHGLGLEAHEEPYMFSENEMILIPGMTFTIEPGIYLPGKGGVRIEDDVVITEDGCESLSTMDRDLITLSGT
jgi:Xaa-Pro dipeptidase